MIKSFDCKETERIFNRGFSRKIPHDIQKVAMRKLWMIDAATHIEDLRIPPANQLKLLKGQLKKFHSIRINDQWRVIFIWKENNAFDVKIIDYH